MAKGNKDPFGPPKKPMEVICIHCDDRYISSEMKYESRGRDPEEYWYCRNADCDGAGFGFDIFSAAEYDKGNLSR